MFSSVFLVFILISFVSPRTAVGFDDAEEIKSSKFTVPRASTFFAGDYLTDKSPDELKVLYAQGLMKLISSPLDAMQILTEAARYGYAPAMLSLGNNVQDLTERLHYYIIAFETHWLQTGEHYKQALTAMNKLGTKPALSFSIFQSQVYVEDKKSDEIFHDIAHLHALNFELIYLTSEDVKCITQKFLKQIQEKCAVGDLFLQYAQDPQYSAINKGFFFNFSAFLYQQSEDLKANYQIGVMYQKGDLGKKEDGKPNYRQAAHWFKKSEIPEAKQNLGVLYIEKQINQRFKGDNLDGPYLSDHERYQEAAKWFTQSGTPEAKGNLASMYVHGEVKQKFIDYELTGPYLSGYELHQEAAILFAESGLPLAEYNLGVLYLTIYQQILNPQCPPLTLYPQLTQLERYQKALDHFTSAFLRGVEKAKPIISNLRELIKIEKKRLIKEERLKRARTLQETTSCVATSSHYVEGFQEDHREETRAVPYVKAKQPKISREERIQQLKDEIAKAKIIRISGESRQTQTFPIRFGSEKVREDFESMQSDPHYMNKLKELMAIIHQDPRGAKDSTGQCESLKYHKDHYSRRMNQKDRLVYIFDGKQIIIVSCKGHYDDLK